MTLSVSRPRMSRCFWSMLCSKEKTVSQMISRMLKGVVWTFSSPASMRERFSMLRTSRDSRFTSSETMRR